MACKNKIKRARPSAHLKSVKTRDGKKVVVVNRDVKKKVLRKRRYIPVKSKKVVPMGGRVMGKIRKDSELAKPFDPLDVLKSVQDRVDNRELSEIHKKSFPGFEKEKHAENVRTRLQAADAHLVDLGFHDYMSVLNRLEAEEKEREKKEAREKFLKKFAEDKEEASFKSNDGVVFSLLQSDDDFDSPDAYTWSGVMSSGFEPLNKENSKKIRSGKK
jgi:hypothetical protein